jgi:hypothetical protein
MSTDCAFQSPGGTPPEGPKLFRCHLSPWLSNAELIDLKWSLWNCGEEEGAVAALRPFLGTILELGWCPQWACPSLPSLDISVRHPPDSL